MQELSQNNSGGSNNTKFESSLNLDDQRNRFNNVIDFPSVIVGTSNVANFARQNSLQFSKIQRHSTRKNDLKPKSNNCANLLSSSNNSNFAVPEFLEKSTMPLIRLRAQSIKKVFFIRKYF